MIKYVYIISFLIFISCNQLVEKTSPLDGIYYIVDGWEKFEAEDYDRAHDLFSTVLLNNSTDYIFCSVNFLEDFHQDLLNSQKPLDL